MRQFGFFASALGLPMLLIMAGGCTKSDTGPKIPARPFVPTVRIDKRSPLDVQDRSGVVSGRIVFDGEPPPWERIARIDLHGDKEGCNKGGVSETSKQMWFVNKDNHGVRYVVVWLEPPADKYFPLTDKETKRDGQVIVIDQPHCAFVPHVATLFPSYFDGTKQEKTGQVLEVRNSAPFLHTIQWDPTRDNEMMSHNLPPREKKQFVLNPQKKAMAFGCGAHNWMLGFLMIFEHPYNTVSDENGAFQIKNVPTDVELTFKAWHESSNEPFEVRKVTLKKGDNSIIDLKLKMPERKSKK